MSLVVYRDLAHSHTLRVGSSTRTLDVYPRTGAFLACPRDRTSRISNMALPWHHMSVSMMTSQINGNWAVFFNTFFRWMTKKATHKARHCWPFVKGINHGPMDSPHKGPVMRNDVMMFPQVSCPRPAVQPSWMGLTSALRWNTFVEAWDCAHNTMCSLISWPSRNISSSMPR